MGAQAGPAARVQIGVTVHHQQLQPGDMVQDRVQRRQLPPVELTRPARLLPGWWRDLALRAVLAWPLGVREDKPVGCRLVEGWLNVLASRSTSWSRRVIAWSGHGGRR